MSKLEFNVNKYKDGFSILWCNQKINEIVTDNMFDLIFNKIKANNIGIYVNLNSHHPSILWLSDSVYCSDINHKYQNWLVSQYEIMGFIFANMNQVDQFKNEIEKLYMWDIIKS